jgi:hypothetical protein
MATTLDLKVTNVKEYEFPAWGYGGGYETRTGITGVDAEGNRFWGKLPAYGAPKLVPGDEVRVRATVKEQKLNADGTVGITFINRVKVLAVLDADFFGVN